MILRCAAFVCSLLLYLYAFFPFITKNSHGVDPPTNLHEIAFDGSDFLEPQFKRLVFMVVDALRLDFVNSRNMPYVSTQLSGSNGCFLSVKVESPTVTLPRIKAITSGSVPQFIDVILNLIQTETIEDSFLQKAVAKNKSLVFYGDDTWLKLYPNLFVRSEGTTSFYVNDFSEVDENVTRNVNEELKKTDWDMMFLHYLGLDHIGHVLGPYSHLIPDKLLEMDKIVQKIHEATKKVDNNQTLVIVTGDHGMKDSGGHGGATFAETNVPLIILGQECINSSIAQTDISTTIALLMGLEIPKNSIGKLPKTLFNNLPYRKILYALRYNAMSLKTKSPKHDDIFQNATNAHYKFLKSNSTEFAKIAIDLYDEYCSLVSAMLIKTSVVQNVSLLTVSCCLMILNFTASLCGAFIRNEKSVVNKKLLFTITVTSIISETVINSIFLSFLLMVIIAIGVFYNVAILAKNVHLENSICTFLLFGLIVHALTLFSSSFVEEEHQFWYYFAGTFLFLHAYTDLKTSLVIFLGLRFLRMMNQTGDKWASSPDLALWFLQPENSLFLKVFVTASLILVFVCTNNNSKELPFLNCFILVLIFIFKNSTGRNVTLGQLIWFLIFAHFTISVMKKAPLVNTWVLICTLLLKPYNIIMITACIGASFFIRNLPANGLILWHILLGGVLFFCQGHSNSLASVNIAAGFIGLNEYRPFLVIIQTILHTYALIILSHFTLVQRVNGVRALSVVLVHRMYVLTVMCVTTVIFRHHLFVWTVFAPKLLIETSHFMVTLIEIVVYTMCKKIK